MENSQTNKAKENEGQKSSLNLVGASTRRGDGVDSQSGAATATARTYYDHAKETAGQAYTAVTDKAAGKLDEQRSTLSDGLSAVADSVRQVSSNLGSSQTDSGLAEAAARYTDTAAQKIESVAGYFENKDVRAMARDLESFARRNPAIFIGAAFGLGLVVARFLKSSAPDRYNGNQGKRFGSVKDDRSSLRSTSLEEGTRRRESSEFNARPQ